MKNTFTKTINDTKLFAKKGDSHVAYYNNRFEVGFNTEDLRNYEHFLSQCEKYNHQIKIYDINYD